MNFPAVWNVNLEQVGYGLRKASLPEDHIPFARIFCPIILLGFVANQIARICDITILFLIGEGWCLYKDFVIHNFQYLKDQEGLKNFS